STRSRSRSRPSRTTTPRGSSQASLPRRCPTRRRRRSCSPVRRATRPTRSSTSACWPGGAAGRGCRSPRPSRGSSPSGPERARPALREAGDRAFGLYAYSAAARFYGRALELWPADDPERASLLFRYGSALFHGEAEGADELEEARAGLLEARRMEDAAEADALLTELWWHRGRRDRAFVHLE